MPNPSFAILGYAAFIVLGGLIGWRMSGSRKSLTSSLISAAALSVAYRVSRIRPLAGFLIAVAVACTLAFFFLMRYRKTGKIMPAATMMAVSATAAAYFLWSAFR